MPDNGTTNNGSDAGDETGAIASPLTASATLSMQPPGPMQIRDHAAWPKWARRFERFRHVSGLAVQDQATQVHALVYAMGEEAEDILDSFGLTKDQQSDYQTVLDKFEKHFIPQRNITYERAKFNARKQEQDESVDQFVTDLHKLAESCSFGAMKEELIRDRLVTGLSDKQLSETLQLDPELTLQVAVAKARNKEAVRSQQSVVHELSTPGQKVGAEVDAIRKFGNRKTISALNKTPAARSQNKTTGYSENCQRCGSKSAHARRACPAIQQTCRKCGKSGHFARVCKSTKVVRPEPTRTWKTLGDVTLGEIKGACRDRPWMVAVNMQGKEVEAKVDTGADVTAIPNDLYEPNRHGPLKHPEKRLFGPGRNKLNVAGKFQAVIEWNGKQTTQEVYVVRHLSTALLGRPAIRALEMIAQINDVTVDVKREFPHMFQGLGKIAEHKYRIKLKDGAVPYAVTVPRRVPIPLLPSVKAEIDRTLHLGVIEPVTEATEWCAPMVVVRQKGKSVRICTGFEELNQYIERERTVMPTVEESIAKVKGACYFSKLDANKGFWQIEVAEESRDLLTFITPFGRYRYKRLPFGINAGPEHFQRTMQQFVGDMEGVVVHMDDILVAGRTKEEHDRRLRRVLRRLREKGITLNYEKCMFCKKEVHFLGHRLNAEGISPDEEKVQAIMKMPKPTNVAEVRSFLGMVNHMAKFLPDVAIHAKPLHELLQINTAWIWDAPQETAFKKLKSILATTPVLAYYDPNKKHKVSADASSYGIGGVLLQEQDGGHRQPVAYVSRRLTETESRYAQVEKEALAITWACEKFRSYLVGLPFQVETDHKPLLSLLRTKRIDDVPPRIQRYRLRLMEYSFSISHVPGKSMYTADVLSRNPTDEAVLDYLGMEETEKLHTEFHPASPDYLKKLIQSQDNDEECQQAKAYCMNGWPEIAKLPTNLKPYAQVSTELTIVKGLLLRGQRIVIPSALRNEVMSKLHEGHMGVSKTRGRASTTVWWPAISKEVSSYVAQCLICLKNRQQPTEEMIATKLPEGPWQKIGMDLCEHEGNNYLIVVDYYSRFFEMERLRKTTSEEVIVALKKMFARFGIPLEIRADNGTQFVSKEFQQFQKEYDFQLITSSPYYPRSNGEAERAVQTGKKLLVKNQDFQKGLMAYRTAPGRTGYTPAQLLMGRNIRSTVPASPETLKAKWPKEREVRRRDEEDKARQKENYDRRHRVRNSEPLQLKRTVWMNREGQAGRIIGQRREPRSYLVQTEGRSYRRNRRDLVPFPTAGNDPR